MQGGLKSRKSMLADCRDIFTEKLRVGSQMGTGDRRAAEPPAAGPAVNLPVRHSNHNVAFPLGMERKECQQADCATKREKMT